MPRLKDPREKVRLTLELTETVRRRLEELQTLSEADSMTETIRRALAVYDTLLVRSKAGENIFVRDADGKERELILR